MNGADDISDAEAWLRIFCAAVAKGEHPGVQQSYAPEGIADTGLPLFRKRFPRTGEPETRTGTYRGHTITSIDGEVWIYADTGELVREAPDRRCGHCSMPNTREGHDGCLGTVPGVQNACCGHGIEGDAYVQLGDGTRLAGAAAITFFANHGRGPS